MIPRTRADDSTFLWPRTVKATGERKRIPRKNSELSPAFQSSSARRPERSAITFRNLVSQESRNFRVARARDASPGLRRTTGVAKGGVIVSDDHSAQSREGIFSLRGKYPRRKRRDNWARCALRASRKPPNEVNNASDNTP